MKAKGQTSWNEIKDLSFMEWNGCAAEGRPAHNQQKKKEKKTNNSLHFIQSISLIEMKKELICLLIEEEKNEEN